VTKRQTGKRVGQRGFTIIEFMVAVALLGVLMLGVGSSFTFQQETYVVVDQVAEAKQNVRVVADLIERELRNAGYMVPNTGAACGVDADDGPDKLYVSDSSAIVAMSALPTTLLSRPLGAVVAGASAAGVPSGSQTVTLDTFDLDGMGGTDFVVGSGLILADRNEAATSVACGTITAVAAVGGGGNVTVDLENSTGGLPAGAELVAVPAIVYQLVGNQLRRNGVVIVDQVEDLQLAWFFDLDDDQLVDPGEYKADGDGGADDYDPTTLDSSLLREVRVNLVVRTRDEDPNETWQGGIGQVTENRDADSVAPMDGARRRIHRSTVRLRNNVS
jgi:prepilin-type N-terminal cleavage/methylation domain-containing protein